MKRVLIVDDHAENLYFLEALLGSQGLEVVSARDGVQALELARKGPPDLVVSDILMPVMDGYTLCRELKADPRLCHIPFVFYTATYTDPRDRQLGYELGAEAFLTKPSEPEDFLAALMPLLTRDETRPAPAASCPITPPESTMTHYSEALVRRLEDKMTELEEANRKLKEEVAERERVEQALLASAEQLRQAQKMEALGQLAGGIAHDFNNQLTTIAGYGELLLSRPEVTSSPAARQEVTEIMRAARRASALTRRILVFSRRQTWQPVVICLNQIVRGMRDLLDRTLGAHIAIECHLDPDLEPVEIDVHQFEQVLTNLALNARDAMPEGGTLTLSTRMVTLDAQFCRDRPGFQPGPAVLLEVADTGLGMDPEVLERLGEPFFTTKPPGQGTGLGLTTVLNTIRQAQGHLQAQSRPGSGSTFQLFLPVADGHAEALDSSETAPELPRGTETLLVVEDDPILCDLMVRMLESLGYSTRTAGTGEAALTILADATCPLDFLMTDLVMPGRLQGWELARKARGLRPGIPVLCTSGHQHRPSADQDSSSQGFEFLEKPFTRRDLAEKVREMLDRKSSGAPREPLSPPDSGACAPPRRGPLP